jgi:hypothetical protein
VLSAWVGFERPTKARWLVIAGAAVLAIATLLPWWHVGGGSGELPARGDVGISDVRGLLAFLAAAAAILLATVRYAAGGPARFDRPATYLALLAVAAGSYAVAAVDLVRQGLAPWPPLEMVGFWIAPIGLLVLVGGVVAVFRAERAEAGAVEDAKDAEDADDAEPRGRLDKLDVVVVSGLLVAVLSMRLFGLGQPTQMYFDEIYHARTATEFLQDWRYGTPHSIYEWTHPMLAKYAMAGGIALFSDDRVTASSELNVPVKDAVIQQASTAGSATTHGDRAFVATGSEVRVYDLATRALVRTYAIPGASALSEPTAAGLVFVGTSQGAIYAIDTNAAAQAPTPLTVNAGFAMTHLFAGAAPYLLVADAAGDVISIDTTAGGSSIAGRATIPGAADFAEFGAAAAEAQPGSGPEVLVAYHDGVALVDARNLTIESTVATGSPATSLAHDRLSGGDPYRVYVAAGRSVLLVDVAAGTPPSLFLESDQTLATMPGPVTTVVFDEATRIVHALGRTPDGAGWTVYAIEANGNAVFSDAALPFEPVAIGLDNAVAVQPSGQVAATPQADREELLAFAADGSIASVDVGQFAFSWRVVGVLFGALMAVCLYLLARMLFRRRSVGLLVAFFSTVDGMFFAQSRIATNDTYVAGLLLLAYLIFAALWLEVPKNRLAFWLGMPALGAILGLALASKWVAIYAIASMVMLVLIRSALGRLVTILGLAGAAGVLGWLSIAGGGGASTYTIFLILLAATAAASAINAYRPIAWTRDELRFAIAGPPVLGFVGPLVIAILLVPIGLPVNVGALAAVMAGGAIAGLAVGLLAGAAFWIAGRLGLGPLAPSVTLGAPESAEPERASAAEPPAPGLAAPTPVVASPAPEGWLRPGSNFGLPTAWTAFCLAILPLAIYVALYIPWAMPWQSQAGAAAAPLPAIACWHVDGATGICDNAWPAGHTGQTLWDLTVQMYDYHNDLRATHAASSPWWAWPLDLRPVWFQSGSTDGSFSAIHDGGNVALWWLAIPGIAFAAWQAFRRKSLALGLVVMAFLWLWLGWSRIERTTFEYHFYTALPFFFIGLAYFLAELWRGPSPRTWLLARVGLAAALLLPAALWILRPGLCGLAGVDSSGYFGSTVCGSATANLGLPSLLVPGLAVAGIAGAVLALSARNPRLLVLGVCGLAALFFAFDYPDLAAVWLPNSLQSVFGALIPTWQYGFQFSSDLQAASPVQLLGPGSAGLTAVALAAAVAAGAGGRFARRRDVGRAGRPQAEVGDSRLSG